MEKKQTTSNLSSYDKVRLANTMVSACMISNKRYEYIGRYYVIRYGEPRAEDVSQVSVDDGAFDDAWNKFLTQRTREIIADFVLHDGKYADLAKDTGLTEFELRRRLEEAFIRIGGYCLRYYGAINRSTGVKPDEFFMQFMATHKATAFKLSDAGINTAELFTDVYDNYGGYTHIDGIGPARSNELVEVAKLIKAGKLNADDCIGLHQDKGSKILVAEVSKIIYDNLGAVSQMGSVEEIAQLIASNSVYVKEYY